MTTDKISVQALVEICYRRGLRNVIFSPGSRNAPLVIAFSEHGGFETRVIADERVAAFFALGQGLATGIPSIICCTSGTAGLNYAPAIAEAYYQEIPMLVLTADRPEEYIDMGLGQSMRQKNMYANYIKKSYQFIQEAIDKADLIENERISHSSISDCLAKPLGPVHINFPFSEPLYGRANAKELILQNHDTVTAETKESPQIDEVVELWQKSNRKMILVGQGHIEKSSIRALVELARRGEVILLTETTSNIKPDKSQNVVIDCIDKVLPLINHNHNCQPDLLISIGGAIVSKRIKSYLTKYKPTHHIICCHTRIPRDTYKAMTHHLKMDSSHLLSILSQQVSKNDLIYNQAWTENIEISEKAHGYFLSKVPYSDLKVFDYLLSHLPQSSLLHLANSTPIRYTQLFKNSGGHTFFCNRGVCGIDGSTTTAMGYSSKSNVQNFMITGDVSFFYDSNAFWINNIPKNFKVILINNGGGNIFRYIGGPDTSNQMEVFESPHQLRANHLCQMYGLSHFSAEDFDELQTTFPAFLSSNEGRTQLLEIITPAEKNAEILREYFEFLEKTQA